MNTRLRGPVLSIANRLAMLFGAITLGVIGVVYIYVVPPLESQQEKELDRILETAARETVKKKK